MEFYLHHAGCHIDAATEQNRMEVNSYIG